MSRKHYKEMNERLYLDRNIEIFIKVAEFNSFTVCCSGAIHITACFISHASKHLEDELKVQLFLP